MKGVQDRVGVDKDIMGPEREIKNTFLLYKTNLETLR